VDMLHLDDDESVAYELGTPSRTESLSIYRQELIVVTSSMICNDFDHHDGHAPAHSYLPTCDDSIVGSIDFAVAASSSHLRSDSTASPPINSSASSNLNHRTCPRCTRPPEQPKWKCMSCCLHMMSTSTPDESMEEKGEQKI
jgi:hypothetical protein